MVRNGSRDRTGQSEAGFSQSQEHRDQEEALIGRGGAQGERDAAEAEGNRHEAEGPQEACIQRLGPVSARLRYTLCNRRISYRELWKVADRTPRAICNQLVGGSIPLPGTLACAARRRTFGAWRYRPRAGQRLAELVHARQGLSAGPCPVGPP